MTRFFVSSDKVSENTINLGKEDSEHIRSLRLRPGELFIISDGCLNDYICCLSNDNSDATATVAKVVERRVCANEPTVKCTNYIAYSKGDRLDYAVQKSVELGVYEIVLYESVRCVAVPNNVPKKIARLQKIALETAKQCGRGIVPKVSSAENFESVITAASASAALSLFFYEYESSVHLKDVLEENNELQSVAIITGPEGGFEPHEAEFAKNAHVHTVSLGPRILRCETAPVVALTAVMYHTENL